MNQAQRKFLIDRVTEQVNMQIKLLEEEKPPQPPSVENYLYGLALTDKLVLKSGEELLSTIKKMAMNHSADNYRSSWLGSDRGAINDKTIHIPITSVFEIPDDYKSLWSEYRNAQNVVREKIDKLKIERDTLTTRIQLASDKTLERMISEIDDMGDLSLMDTKLRQLIAPSSEQNQKSIS